MQQRYPECRCEDYPCCGHYDIIYGDENQPEFCDMCGGYHPSSIDCQYEDEEDWEDEDDDPEPPNPTDHLRHVIGAGTFNLVEE